jgi:hypothetical protein
LAARSSVDGDLVFDLDASGTLVLLDTDPVDVDSGTFLV